MTMARFLVGLILGFFGGALAAAYEPTLPADLRSALADATTLVDRDAQNAAQSVGHAAGNLENQTERARQGAPREDTAPSGGPATR
jgi:hypothetical protein